MIIVLKPGAGEADLEHIVQRIERAGLRAHVSRGTLRTVVGVIGDEEVIRSEPLDRLPGVERVLAVLRPYKLASLDLHPEPTVVNVRGVRIGRGTVTVIAGPCTVESEAGVLSIARSVQSAGGAVLRGGAFKPRTSPYSFQGLGEEGLKFLHAAGRATGLPTVTEVMDVRQVDLVCRYADMLQIGARNMQNFSLLTEAGKTGRPVLLKRGMAASVTEWLMSAEYVLSQSASPVILCERGIKSFEDSTRFTLDLSAVPNVQASSHLPVMVDPSHATGRSDLVGPMALAAVAAGADGVMIEVHDAPDEAKCDGQQALVPSAFARLLEQIRGLADLLQKTMAKPT
jgi:3-deoxy-7-phosphoheptulonate synthase